MILEDFNCCLEKPVKVYTLDGITMHHDILTNSWSVSHGNIHLYGIADKDWSKAIEKTKTIDGLKILIHDLYTL